MQLNNLIYDTINSWNFQEFNEINDLLKRQFLSLLEVNTDLFTDIKTKSGSLIICFPYDFTFTIHKANTVDIQNFEEVLCYINYKEVLQVCSLIFQECNINAFYNDFLSLLQNLSDFDNDTITRFIKTIQTLFDLHINEFYYDKDDCCLIFYFADGLALTITFDFIGDILPKQLDSFNNFIPCFKSYLLMEKI